MDSIDAARPISLSVRDAAARLGISRQALYEDVKAGRIGAVRYGNKILIPVGELEAFFARLAPYLGGPSAPGA